MSPSSRWTKASARLAEARRDLRAKEKAETILTAAAEVKAAQERERAREAARREAARLAAAAVAETVAAERANAARAEADKSAALASRQAAAKAKLWTRCKKASEIAGLRVVGSGKLVAVTTKDVQDLTAERITAAASRLREIIVEARRAEAIECERTANKAYKAAMRRATALERSAALLAQWRREVQADNAVEAVGEGHGSARLAATRAAAAQAVAAAEKAEAAVEAAEIAEARQADLSQESAALSPMSEDKPLKQPETDDSKRTMGAQASTGAAGVAPQFQQGRDVPVPTLLAEARMQALPPSIAVPPISIKEMRNSLAPVLTALNPETYHGKEGEERLSSKQAAAEIEAAKNAWASWHRTSWFDARTSEFKSKAIKGWTPEQYNLLGFASLYARKLHVPRTAAARQVVLWLLQCAPGLPQDAPLTFGDLGAGTCAAYVHICLRTPMFTLV